jgi:hypothetical protein
VDVSLGYAFYFPAVALKMNVARYRRELITESQSGGMVIFEDHPINWDAWGQMLCSFRKFALADRGRRQMWRYIILKLPDRYSSAT